MSWTHAYTDLSVCLLGEKEHITRQNRKPDQQQNSKRLTSSTCVFLSSNCSLLMPSRNSGSVSASWTTWSSLAEQFLRVSSCSSPVNPFSISSVTASISSRTWMKRVQRSSSPAVSFLVHRGRVGSLVEGEDEGVEEDGSAETVIVDDVTSSLSIRTFRPLKCRSRPEGAGGWVVGFGVVG